MAGFTSNGFRFYFAENGFQEIQVDFSLQKDVLYNVSKDFLTHPSSVKGCYRALPGKLSKCPWVYKLVGFLPQPTANFNTFAKVVFYFLLVMETARFIL